MKTKKLLLSVGGALVLGIGAYLNLQQVQNQTQVSDLTFANIEAMADYRIDIGGQIETCQTYTNTCISTKDGDKLPGILVVEGPITILN